MAGSNWFTEWDKKDNGALGIVVFTALLVLLIWAPLATLQFCWKMGHPKVGAGIAGPLSVGLSLTSSAFWNAYLKPAANAWYGVFGVMVVLIGLVLVDGLKHAVEGFPAKSTDEQAMRGTILLWIGVTAFAAKTPWDDLRDKFAARLRAWLERSAN
jgi:hypothetical protein